MEFSTVLLEKYSNKIEINFSPQKKGLLEKFILKKKWCAKVLVGGLPSGRAVMLVGVFRNFRVAVGVSSTKGDLTKISLLLIIRLLL